MVRKGLTWGMFIRNYLLEHGEAYINELLGAYNMYLASMGYKPIKYSTMRKYVWILRKLGLVKVTRIQPPTEEMKQLQPRIYIAIVEGKEDDPAWYNPQVAYNPEWGLGSARYVRKGVKFFEEKKE